MAADGSPEGPNGVGAFACSLCLVPARDPVIGRCGHLYCWPCLHQVPPSSPGSSFHVSFGFGVFPFAFFSAVPQPPPAATGDAADAPPASLDSVFLFLAAAFFLWLLSV